MKCLHLNVLSFLLCGFPKAYLHQSSATDSLSFAGHRYGCALFVSTWFVIKCYCLYLSHSQSMKRTACVRVLITWTCTSKWSGSTMSTAKTYLSSRAECQSTQRECVFFPLAHTVFRWSEFDSAQWSCATKKFQPTIRRPVTDHCRTTRKWLTQTVNNCTSARWTRRLNMSEC